MAGRRRTARDRRRRNLGQNFLTDRRVIERFVASIDLREDELVVEIGTGRGALTRALAEAGARVWTVERDPVWADRAGQELAAAGLADRVRMIRADARRLRLPSEPFRVAANPPFGLTTDILAMLLDRPERGPTRADLILQREVARKHAATPPVALRTAAWAPWWRFELGRPVPRDAFRPRPSIDAQVLHIHRRTPPLLPNELAPGFRDALRPAWDRVRR